MHSKARCHVPRCSDFQNWGSISFDNDKKEQSDEDEVEGKFLDEKPRSFSKRMNLLDIAWKRNGSCYDKSRTPT
jgi:hypothetical protein